MQLYIATDDHGHLKVGVSKDAHVRVNNIRSGSPYGLRLLFWLGTPDAHALERAVFERCAKWRLNGEWLKECEEVWKVLNQITEGQIDSFLGDDGQPVISQRRVADTADFHTLDHA